MKRFLYMVAIMLGVHGVSEGMQLRCSKTLPQPTEYRVATVGWSSFQQQQSENIRKARDLAGGQSLLAYKEALSRGINQAFLDLLSLISSMPAELLQTGSTPPSVYREVLGKRVLEWFQTGIQDENERLMKSAVVCFCVSPRDVFHPQKGSLFMNFVFAPLERAKPAKLNNGIDCRLVDCWTKMCDFIQDEHLSYIKNEILEGMYNRGLTSENSGYPK